jgi:hypothetical protein
LHPRSPWLQLNETSSDEELDGEEGDEGRKIEDEDMENFSTFIENGKKIGRIEENLYAESLVQVPCEKVFLNK